MLQLQRHRMQRYRRSWLPDGMKPRAKCLIAEGKKCEFFRRTVLCEDCCQNPTSVEAENSRPYSKEVIISKEYLMLQEERLKALDWVCKNCGQPRRRGRTYCETCRKTKERESNRKRKRKYRRRQRTCPRFS